MGEIIVVKMGGVASDNLTEGFFNQVRSWQAAGKKVVIVHGGGHYITEMMKRLNVPVAINDGLRVTTLETLQITKMVLIGQVQPAITTILQQNGFSALGLNASSGQLLTGDFIDQETLGYVGEINQVETAVLDDVLASCHIPVIAPLGMTEEGDWLNINADCAACKIAEALQAEALYLLTDVPGVKKHGVWLDELCIDDLDYLKKEKIIKGGMIPKMESAADALNGGVGQVHITNAIESAGTVITKEGVLV